MTQGEMLGLLESLISIFVPVPQGLFCKPQKQGLLACTFFIGVHRELCIRAIFSREEVFRLFLSLSIPKRKFRSKGCLLKS